MHVTKIAEPHKPPVIYNLTQKYRIRDERHVNW